MNQLIDLLDSALQANLTKRQWAAFAVVLRQTLGYRKQEDDISARRFEQLSGIRRNHIWQAKGELVTMGLLKRRRGQYGEIIGFTAAANTSLPPPKTGQPSSQIGPKPVPKQDTTLSNLTGDNHDSTVRCDEVPLRYPPDLSTTERQQAPQKLDGLSLQASQQVLDVWALKIKRGEVRKSRIGLLVALINAQRNGTLHTDSLPPAHPANAPDPEQQQRLRERERWLEQKAQRAWQRDMARLSGLPPDQFQIAGFMVQDGAT